VEWLIWNAHCPFASVTAVQFPLAGVAEPSTVKSTVWRPASSVRACATPARVAASRPRSKLP